MLIKMFNIIFFGLIWFGLNGLNHWHFAIVVILLTYFLANWLKLLPQRFKINYKALLYFLWLIKEIIKSSIQVIRIVWSYKINITPTFEWVESKQTQDIGLVIYGNSITLTPGTVTLDIKDNMLLVHALEGDSIKELQHNDVMDTKIKQILC